MACAPVQSLHAASARPNVAGMLTPLLLATALNVLTAADGPDTARVASRLVDQRLELELNPAARTWSGSLLATLELAGVGRRIELRLAGPIVSRVELTDATGRVELTWGAVRDSFLVVEAGRDLAPGPASLNIAFDGGWRDPLRDAPKDTLGAVVRDVSQLRIRMHAGAGGVFPAWPSGTPATRWTLMVHAPSGYDVSANAHRTGLDQVKDWRTWTFRTRAPVEADSLRVSVAPAKPKH